MKESRLWFLHICAGALLVFLLGLHTIIMHFDSILAFFGLIPKEAWTSGGQQGSLNFANSVLPRMKSLSMTVIYSLLALIGLYHGLYGARSIVFEFNIGEKGKRRVNVFFLFFGIAVAAYGLITIISGHLYPPAVR